MSEAKDARRLVPVMPGGRPLPLPGSARPSGAAGVPPLALLADRPVSLRWSERAPAGPCFCCWSEEEKGPSSDASDDPASLPPALLAAAAAAAATCCRCCSCSSSSMARTTSALSSTACMVGCTCSGLPLAPAESDAVAGPSIQQSAMQRRPLPQPAGPACTTKGPGGHGAPSPAVQHGSGAQLAFNIHQVSRLSAFRLTCSMSASPSRQRAPP